MSGNVMKTAVLNSSVGTAFAQLWQADIESLAGKMKKTIIIVVTVCLLTLCMVWNGSAALRERFAFETTSINLQTDQSGTSIILQGNNNQQVNNTNGLPILVRRYLVKSGEFDSVSASLTGKSIIAYGISVKTEPEIATFAGDSGRDKEYYARELALLDVGPQANSAAWVIDRSRDHDRQIVTIGIEPLDFDKTTGSLAAYSNMQLDFHGSADLNLELIGDYGFAKPNVTELQSSTSSSTNNSAEYLIITRADFVDAFSELVKWKTAKGLTVEVAAIGDIIAANSGRDDAERLRNYLISKYESGVKYVLLGGDETVIPIRYAYHANTTTQPPLDLMNICDLYYGDTDGNWDADGDGVFGEPGRTNRISLPNSWSDDSPSIMRINSETMSASS